MWRILIADDEPKIRRGLINFVDWKEFDMEVVGEAEDGEAALEQAKKLKPDIIMMDICMPFSDGLEAIEQINEILPTCVIVIVTGYDNFSYAKQAIKLQVFDYLLKPVSKTQMHTIFTKVREEVTNTYLKNKYLKWTKFEFEKDLPHLTESFLNEWVSGHLAKEGIEEQMQFLGVKLNDNSGMIVVGIIDRLNKDEMVSVKDRYVTLLEIQDIVNRIVSCFKPYVIFRDVRDNIVAVTSLDQLSDWFEIGEKIKRSVDQYLNQTLCVFQEKIDGGISNLPITYEKMIKEINENSECTPIVMLAKKYIDSYYNKKDICLQEVSDEIQVSPTYLSRLLKQETGTSFSNYLTQVRVKKAIQLLHDPSLKIYEIADRVGYSSQHYFCTAFKKILSVSPMKFRNGGGNN
jgi:two-component system response regulator YesN